MQINKRHIIFIGKGHMWCVESIYAYAWKHLSLHAHGILLPCNVLCRSCIIACTDVRCIVVRRRKTTHVTCRIHTFMEVLHSLVSPRRSIIDPATLTRHAKEKHQHGQGKNITGGRPQVLVADTDEERRGTDGRPERPCRPVPMRADAANAWRASASWRCTM
jgi:hypothetical protein